MYLILAIVLSSDCTFKLLISGMRWFVTPVSGYKFRLEDDYGPI